MPADKPRVVGFFGVQFERQIAAPFAGWEVLHDPIVDFPVPCGKVTRFRTFIS